MKSLRLGRQTRIHECHCRLLLPSSHNAQKKVFKIASSSMSASKGMVATTKSPCSRYCGLRAEDEGVCLLKSDTSVLMPLARPGDFSEGAARAGHQNLSYMDAQASCCVRVSRDIRDSDGEECPSTPINIRWAAHFGLSDVVHA